MPLWAQVLEDLRRRLEAGEFVEGFPTDIGLTAHYGVSRHTAREAVRRLQEEGVISRERGRGTFVTSPTIEQPTGAIYSLYRSVEERGLDQRSQVLGLDEVTDPVVAGRLDLAPTEPMVRLERLRLAEGAVLAHDTSWLPGSLAGPLLDVDFGHTALYDELQTRCGVRPTSGSERISTELPDAGERRLLGIAAKQPVFRIQRSSRSGDQVIEWRETVVRGDRFTFLAQWSPAGPYETVLTASGA